MGLKGGFASVSKGMTCSIPVSGGNPHGSANSSAKCDLMPSSCSVSVDTVSGALQIAYAESGQEDVLLDETGRAIGNINVRNHCSVDHNNKVPP